MAKKEVCFEGVIDNVYSQILVDRESDKWFLLGHIKESELNETKAMVDTKNQTRLDDKKVKIVDKMMAGKKEKFIYFEIDKKSAIVAIEKSKKNQNHGKSLIEEVSAFPKRKASRDLFINETETPVKPAKSRIFQNFKQLSPLKIIAGAVLSAAIIGGAAFGLSQMNGHSKAEQPENPAYTTMETSPEQAAPEVEQPRLDLEDVVLEENSLGELTSDSVKALAKAITDELDELYQMSEYELPKIVSVETLSSIFFFENDCKAVDPEEDSYVGIAQIGKDAVKSAILRADRKFQALQENATFVGGDNYIIDNICSMNRDVEALTDVLWEQAKTDPKMCGMLSALCLADLSDRNTTKLNENQAAIVTMYNAGEGNFAKFEQLGIISLDESKKEMTIDLSKVDNITDPELRKKWNESVNYLIKVINGQQKLKANPNANVKSTCQAIRDAVGKNDNYNVNPNLEQYNHAPSGVSFKGLTLEQGAQFGD